MLESLLHFLRSLFDPEGLKELIRTGGPALICSIVFVETGFFVGFFLPGDSLLITAGIFAAAAAVPLRLLLVRWLLPVALCAIIGDLKSRVRARFGLELEEEVQYVGFSLNGAI